MFLGTGTTSSVTHAAAPPGCAVSARPNVLVVLVNTKLSTPAVTASSSSVNVPVTLVSTNASRPCDATWGLCNVATCTTAPTPARQRGTTSRAVTGPATVVNGEPSRS